MRETVEIALAANGPYFCGLLTTACSIAMHASRDVALRFHVLDAGIAEDDKRMVEKKILEFHPQCVFNWLPVEEKMFEGLPKWNGGYMVYTRLLLPQLLRDVDWAVYCDCDFTWMRDIAELWRERDDSAVLISTKDGTGYTLDIEEKWFREHGFPIDREKYFCAGLTFFNLKRFRDEGIDKRCMELLQMHPPYNDQSVLNITAFGRAKLVPQVWQRFTEVVTQDELDRGVVIHHAGEVPWKPLKATDLISDTKLIWFRLNARIHGISLWRSLRRRFGVMAIVMHRLPVYLVRCPVVTHLLALAFFAIRHPGVYKWLKLRSRKLKA